MTIKYKSIGKCAGCGLKVYQVQSGSSEPTEPDPPISPKTHTVWVDKFTGKEKTTKFRSSGDNPQFRRKGAVAFGYWPGRSDRYVYNTKYVDGGKGHVEYHPELTGKYEIKWYYRKTRNRSETPCDVRLLSGGDVMSLKSVPQYASKSNCISIVIGTVDLTASDYISCVPRDRKSISFGKMVFTKVS